MNLLLAVRDWLVRRYVTRCREAFHTHRQDHIEGNAVVCSCGGVMGSFSVPDDDPLDYPEAGGWGT